MEVGKKQFSGIKNGTLWKKLVLFFFIFFFKKKKYYCLTTNVREKCGGVRKNFFFF